MHHIKKFLCSSKVFIYIILAFLAINFISRIGLTAFNQDYSIFLPQHLLPILIIGGLYDLSVSFYWIIPFVLFSYLVPNKFIKTHKIVLGTLLLAAIFAWSFIATSEFVFWHEFSTRFNFIAVDYLIYTGEVIGNIRESYNLTPIFLGIFVFSLAIFYILWKKINPIINYSLKCTQKITYFFVWSGLAIISYLFMPAYLNEFSSNIQINQLAANGQFEFGYAFFHNQINYNEFYATLHSPKLYANNQQNNPLIHVVNSIKNPDYINISTKKPNIVLISVESLSADFLGTFGNTQNITPNLDKLALESLLFTNLYATGTRTVRGLEALSLGILPTPGNSIVKRPNNENLFSLGYVLKNQGYSPMYIYGGYSYFDNMKYFFSNNHYEVIDREFLDKKDIHYQNIWGVADEDLFTLSLRQLDTKFKEKKPFFAHIMTTSNHRPFTYPNGRIDISSKTNREGAVKYTDWAIGDFINRAKDKPWFKNTIFVIVADHCASSRGKTDLPIEKFHIPLMIYAPNYIKPKKIDYIASQIDIAPTLLNMLNINYESKFFGQDILSQGQNNQRAFIANYQTVGMYKDNKIVQLKPQKVWQIMNAKDNSIITQGKFKNPTQKEIKELPPLVNQAITYYQIASEGFTKNYMKNTSAKK